MIRVAVDLHCHILPGLDDGARDLEDAVAMAGQAQADGIEAVCATPHIRHDHDVEIPELAQRRARLTAAVAQAGWATRILAGGEVAASAVNGLTGEELAGVALGGGGRWILLEPDRGPLDERLDVAVETLEGHGYRALIAHPERHLTGDMVARLRHLIDRGALIQATAATVTHRRARSGMRQLAAAGVLHVLASDAHSSRAGRPVRVSDAIEELRSVSGIGEHLDWVAQTAPAAIIAGHELTPPF